VRAEFPAAYDHVLVRGNQLAATFLDEDYGHFFWATLKRN
jgi:hypothetical protein